MNNGKNFCYVKGNNNRCNFETELKETSVRVMVSLYSELCQFVFYKILAVSNGGLLHVDEVLWADGLVGVKYQISLITQETAKYCWFSVSRHSK